MKKSKLVMRTLKFIQEDIDLGRPRLSAECPLARMLNREFGGEWEVLINTAYVLDRDWPRKAFNLTQEMFETVKAIDKGEKVEPQEFLVEESACFSDEAVVQSVV